MAICSVLSLRSLVAMPCPHSLPLQAQLIIAISETSSEVTSGKVADMHDQHVDLFE